MSLISVFQYREITGDSETATAEVDRVLTDAEGLLVDELRRHLEQGTFTETLPIMPHPVSGVSQIFPTVTPVISEANGLTVVFDVIYGATPDSSPEFFTDWAPPAVATVTYVGGFDPDQTDPTARDYVPRSIAHDVAWAAWLLLQPLATSSFSQFPAGAKSLVSGDQQITFAGDEGYAPGTSESMEWSCETLRWKRR